VPEHHVWNLSIKEAAEVQRNLRSRVSLEDGFGEIRLIAGVDVGVPAKTNEGHSVVVVLTYPGFEIVEVQRAAEELQFPYIPGFLSFREAPVILKAFEKLEVVPDIVMVDGQGIAHPRGLGIAAHLGVILDLPTIGCAKSHLFGRYTEPGIERGSVSMVADRQGGQIGDVVRTRSGVKPVFVSPGNKISFSSAVKVVLDCAVKYRLPEPTRIAHKLASG